jgi:cytochrome c peroxidase
VSPFALLIASLLTILATAIPAQDYIWNLPKGFPKPPVPADNPMTVAKVELGRYLFYDTRLSVNGTQACASCHKQELAFTDGRPVAIGATGQKHPRGSMSLVNVAYSKILTWSDPSMTQLEQQALVPMFGEHPVELGLRKDDARFLSTLRSEPSYAPLFAHAFPADPDPFTITNVVKAIACFERSIISARSPYDRYHYGGDETAISDSAKRGEIVFFSQPFTCFTCHGGPTFADNQTPKVPTLRNIALTAPYLHDGSAATLDATFEHNSKGAYRLSADQRRDLTEFLKSLTDDAVLHDPRFSNPWR